MEDKDKLRDELDQLKEFLNTIEMVPTSFFTGKTKVLLVSYQEFEEIKEKISQFKSKD
jgi:thymidine kinase